jgi:hypothetical protein
LLLLYLSRLIIAISLASRLKTELRVIQKVQST